MNEPISVVEKSMNKGLSPQTPKKLLGKEWAEHTVKNDWALPTRAGQQKISWQKRLALRLFRFGFAGVFFINALVAWIQPSDFLILMQRSLATNWLGDLEWMIPVIAVNDLLLGLAILAAPKRTRSYVYAWTGLWFLAITIVKFLALDSVVALLSQNASFS
ncbi:MAG: hypothetical protein ACRCYY_08655 [Trueperaceae bacterium]